MKVLGVGLRANALIISEDKIMVWLVSYITTYLVSECTYVGNLSILAFRPGVRPGIQPSKSFKLMLIAWASYLVLRCQQCSKATEVDKLGETADLVGRNFDSFEALQDDTR